MKNYLKFSGLALVTMLVMMSCSKTDDSITDGESYNTSFEVTDAPIDKTEVEQFLLQLPMFPWTESLWKVLVQQL